MQPDAPTDENDSGTAHDIETTKDGNLRCLNCEIDVPASLDSIVTLAETECAGTPADAAGVDAFQHDETFAISAFDDDGNPVGEEWINCELDDVAEVTQ